MQKEIDALREAQRVLQQRLRDVEMSNDDMERNDRYIPNNLKPQPSPILDPLNIADREGWLNPRWRTYK